MTGKQFATALKALGYSQIALARQHQIAYRSVKRYKAGQWPVPATLAMLLNAMLDRNIRPEELRQ